MSRLPDQIDAPMIPRQLATLRTLSVEAYQPRLFEPNLTASEAARRIDALKAEIELANAPNNVVGKGNIKLIVFHSVDRADDTNRPLQFLNEDAVA